MTLHANLKIKINCCHVAYKNIMLLFSGKHILHSFIELSLSYTQQAADG